MGNVCSLTSAYTLPMPSKFSVCPWISIWDILFAQVMNPWATVILHNKLRLLIYNLLYCITGNPYTQMLHSLLVGNFRKIASQLSYELDLFSHKKFWCTVFIHSYWSSYSVIDALSVCYYCRFGSLVIHIHIRHVNNQP